MKAIIHRYPITIKETQLDVYGHVNNTTYLVLFEEARWDLITQNGYGYYKIMETGFGPVVLEMTVKYQKELRLHDEIIIESQPLSYEKKISKLSQKMIRGSDICCTAEFTIGLFDLKARKLVLPTPEWLQGFGLMIED